MKDKRPINNDQPWVDKIHYGDCLNKTFTRTTNIIFIQKILCITAIGYVHSTVRIGSNKYLLYIYNECKPLWQFHAARSRPLNQEMWSEGLGEGNLCPLFTEETEEVGQDKSQARLWSIVLTRSLHATLWTRQELPSHAHCLQTDQHISWSTKEMGLF